MWLNILYRNVFQCFCTNERRLCDALRRPVNLGSHGRSGNRWGIVLITQTLLLGLELTDDLLALATQKLHRKQRILRRILGV